MKKTPILITGAHRSGSTWVGKMVCRKTDMFYVHEPFNLDIKRDNCPFKYWFEYIPDDLSEEQKKIYTDYIQKFTKPSFKDQIKNFLRIKSINDFFVFIAQLFGFRKRRTVFKDPIGLLSSEFFSEEINCDVVVIVRHPAALRI